MGTRLMTRKTSQWEVRLQDCIKDAHGRPFAWGTHDCLTWAADVMAALTQTPSLADQWRGTYKTARGAAGVLRRRGHASYAEAVTAHLGPALATPALAQRGDVVAGPEGEIGICIGYQAAFIGLEGVALRPIPDCAAAWRV